MSSLRRVRFGHEDRRQGTAHFGLCGLRGVFARLLRRHGDPLPGYEPRVPGTSEYAHDSPTENCWWIGMIRLRDGLFRAICLSKTQGGCWDSLLWFPGEGDRC